MRVEVQVSGDWDYPTLNFRFGLPRIGHLNYGILHTNVAIDHIDNKFFNPALWEKVACTLDSLP